MKQKYVYWQDEEMWLGYLEEYPNYWTQGGSENELRENLIDMFKDLSSGAVPNARRVAELDVVRSNETLSSYWKRWAVSLSVTAAITTGIKILARKFPSLYPSIVKSKNVLPNTSSRCLMTANNTRQGKLLLPNPNPKLHLDSGC